MDVLYGDLENYNEVKIIEDLRDENKHLKLKLEEYETAMGKLQKSLLQDYDKLTLEFDTLQLNYSSLLKTARAEVVRKAQMITQLNAEKDKKILQELQRRTQANKNVSKTSNTYQSADAKNDKEPKNDSQKNESCKSSNECTNFQSDNSKLKIIDRVMDKVDECIYRGDIKESKSGYDSKYKDSLNISTRRKSVNVDVVPKFSSDDESEQEKTASHKIRNDIPADISATSHANKFLTRTSNERFSMKTSDTSSIEARSLNYHEERRDSNRSRNNRISDNERYRQTDRFRESDRSRERHRYRSGDRDRENEKSRDYDTGRVTDKQSKTYREFDNISGRDKYESSQRYRKHYSPDRPHKRSYREYQDEYYRAEHGRRKQEYSHHENYPRYRQKSPDPQPNYDRDCYRRPYEERRASRSYEEPNKRPKLEYTISVAENKQLASDSVVMSTGDDLAYDVQHTSCQSPDVMHPPEIHSDAVPTHTIKEIKTTALMPLDDPRVTSKKYILKDENDTNFLYTVSSQHINIKPIDKSLWNIKSVALPDALLHYPVSDFTEETINEIYTSIDNPNSNESGEISFDSQDIALRQSRKTKPEEKAAVEFNKSDNTFTPCEQKSIEISTSVEYHEQNKTGEISYSKNNNETEAEPNTFMSFNLKENISEVLNDPAIHVPVENESSNPEEIYNNSEKPLLLDSDLVKNSTEIFSKEEPIKKFSKSYKIPKLKRPQSTVSKVSDFCKGLPNIEYKEPYIQKTICTKDDVQPHRKLPHIDVNDDVISSTTIKGKYDCKISELNSRLVSDMAMVQDDLELSDETSDNIEMHNKLTVDKEVIEKPEPDMDITVNHKARSPDILCEPRYVDATTLHTKEVNTKDLDNQKKKSKKKKIKWKELGEITDSASTEKKKSKKEKDSTPEQIKNKFSDLFGDSSSLITPEDLGIPISGASFCDESHDAVDIKIKQNNRPSETNSVTVEACSGRNNNRETTRVTNFKKQNIEDQELPKELVHQSESIQIDNSDVYQNINYDTTDKRDVVKTVIISSGIQPQFTLDDENRTVENRVADVEVNIQNIPNCHHTVDSTDVLATSTPFKELSKSNSDVFSEIDGGSSNNVGHAESADKTGAFGADHSNTHDSIDLPDVRIFVRRRRKGSKKT